MRDRILGLVEKADLVIGSAAEVVDRAELTAFAATVRNTRSRLSSPDDVLIAALVGGTGSGKSSLFNALSGSELAEVGGVRPTTGRPLVAVPEGRAAALAPFFDELGIEDREVAPVPSWLCLIDMPDTDSVELDHRTIVMPLLVIAPHGHAKTGRITSIEGDVDNWLVADGKIQGHRRRKVDVQVAVPRQIRH